MTFSTDKQILLVFSQAHPAFRRAEFEAVCRLGGIDPVPEFSSDGSHVQLLSFPNGQSDAVKILQRAMLVKQAFELISEGTGHDEVLAKLANERENPLDNFNSADQSWSLSVRPQRRKRHTDYIHRIVERYTDVIRLDQAPICLSNPQNIFTVIEQYPEDEQSSSSPRRVFFARFFLDFWLGEGKGHLKNVYSLHRRHYIGNSTMDPELAFIQANLAQARPGSIVLDPFCGTGGLMLPAAHFGASVIGVEIKWDVARAKGKSSRAGEHWLGTDHSIRSNFAQYGMDDGRFLGVILADSSRPKLWHAPVTNGSVDAIITDPPYGIREKGQRLGKNRKGRRKSGEETHTDGQNELEADEEEELPIIDGAGNEDRIANSGASFPAKQKYAMSTVFLDLMDLAIWLLRLGGHLAFWFPICRSEYSDRCLPRSNCLRLIHNCEQPLTRDSARRLLVYEKYTDARLESNEKLMDKAYYEVDCYAEETFRHKIFNKNGGDETEERRMKERSSRMRTIDGEDDDGEEEKDG